MSIRPSPIAYTCLACGWSKTVVPKSDALMPGDYFAKCPKCGHRALQSKVANITMANLSGLAKIIKKLVK